MKEIPLTQGKVALVDDEDYERVAQFKWCVSDHGRMGHIKWYACTGNSAASGKDIRGRTKRKRPSLIRMHRFIMGVTDKRVVHHKDDNGLNNQKSNLEILKNNNYNMAYSKGWTR